MKGSNKPPNCCPLTNQDRSPEVCVMVKTFRAEAVMMLTICRNVRMVKEVSDDCHRFEKDADGVEPKNRQGLMMAVTGKLMMMAVGSNSAETDLWGRIRPRSWSVTGLAVVGGPGLSCSRGAPVIRPGPSSRNEIGCVVCRQAS